MAETEVLGGGGPSGLIRPGGRRGRPPDRPQHGPQRHPARGDRPLPGGELRARRPGRHPRRGLRPSRRLAAGAARPLIGEQAVRPTSARRSRSAVPSGSRTYAVRWPQGFSSGSLTASAPGRDGALVGALHVLVHEADLEPGGIQPSPSSRTLSAASWRGRRRPARSRPSRAPRTGRTRAAAAARARTHARRSRRSPRRRGRSRIV